MIIYFKFIGILELKEKQTSIDINLKDKLSVRDALIMVSHSVGLDFIRVKDRFMFSVDSKVLKYDELSNFYLKNLDTITIMPMLSGG